MSCFRQLTYRGVSIRIRWVELEPAGRGLRRFAADFSLGKDVAGATEREPPIEPVFDTHGHAAEYALVAARRAIDASADRARRLAKRAEARRRAAKARGA